MSLVFLRLLMKWRILHSLMNITFRCKYFLWLIVLCFLFLKVSLLPNLITWTSSCLAWLLYIPGYILEPRIHYCGCNWNFMSALMKSVNFWQISLQSPPHLLCYAIVHLVQPVSIPPQASSGRIQVCTVCQSHLWLAISSLHHTSLTVSGTMLMSSPVAPLHSN